jgi:tRNA (cmo5U34)-methyltransferase
VGMKEKMVKIFEDMGGESYDKGNSLFYPININLHFLNALILKDLPKNARILCVGVGTGADIIDLAKTNSEWTFVGLEPAFSMLQKCEEKLKSENLINRCELFQSYLEDFKSTEKFDAVLCLYVMHFIKDMNEKAKMYSAMASHLKKDGYMIITEISADFDSENYKFQLENWKALHGLAGASKEKLESMSKMLQEQLGVISSSETERLIEGNGFGRAVKFFQSFLVCGWYTKIV